MNNTPLIISFSGGRSSAYMCYMLQKHYPEMPKAYVFANTGKEREETLQFVDQCDKKMGLNLVWIEAVINQEKGIGVSYRIVDFKTASRKGEPFEAMIRKFGIPNKDYPHCNRELKIYPIGKYCKELMGGGKYNTAIGIRIDEAGRANRKDSTKVYPLIDWFPTWEMQVRNFWAGQDYDLQLKDYEGNCDLCWKKSLRKRMTIIAENPQVAAQWQQWETEQEGGYVFDRDGYTITQIAAATKKPFRRAQDRYRQSQNILSLFPEEFETACPLEGYKGDMDRESKCHCNE